MEPNNRNYYDETRDYDDVMSVKDWFTTELILAIPIVNIVMLFVWGFGGNVNENKKNYCRASLIIGVIALVLYIIISLVTGEPADLYWR